MEAKRWIKELPLSGQFGAIIALWSIWLLAIGLVIWKEWEMRQTRPLELFADPFWIYSLLFAGFPAVLVGLGISFLLHAPFTEALPHRTLRWCILALNFIGSIVFLTCGLLSVFAFFFAQQVRE